MTSRIKQQRTHTGVLLKSKTILMIIYFGFRQLITKNMFSIIYLIEVHVNVHMQKCFKSELDLELYVFMLSFF